MRKNVTIFHNPRCSKSRRTLALLHERGIEPEIVDYLKNPPETQEIARLLKLLGLSAREFIRRKEAAYAEHGLDAEALDEAQLIEAMRRHPILIERPIVVVGAAAAIGRPPENVLPILPPPA